MMGRFTKSNYKEYKLNSYERVKWIFRVQWADL